jgi:hypothetical protein
LSWLIITALEPDFEVVAQAQDGERVPDVARPDGPDIPLLNLKKKIPDGKHNTRVIVMVRATRMYSCKP